MTSCGGIVSVTVRRSTRTIRSTTGTSSDEAGPADGQQAAEPEDDRALVLAQDAHAAQQHGEGDDGDRTTATIMRGLPSGSATPTGCALVGRRRRDARRRPCDGVGSGKPAGWARKSRSSQPARRAPPARKRGEQRRLGGRVVADAARPPARAAPARRASARSPRWKRPASECGQGSSGRTISRPSVGVGARRPCAGSRCRCAPWPGSGRGAARGRTRAATGARPRGSSSGRAARRSRSRRCASAASAGACGPRATRARRPPSRSAGVAGGQQHLGRSRDLRRRGLVRAGLRHALGLEISVNRMSSGSSSVTRLTVCRMPT